MISLQLFSLALLIAPAFSAPTERLDFTPAIAADFPDPAVINVRNMWYVFGTNNGKYNVQIANSQDFNTWNVLAKDALPNLPLWVNVDSAAVWAPDVSQLDDGTFLLYFSAALAQYPAHRCIGAATSASIEGPYSPMDMPLICPDPNWNGNIVDSIINSSGQGGAIDASGFKDVDGTRYIVYKVDGNSLGSGGSCNNGNGQKSTPIMLVPVDANGVTPLGQAVTLLDHTRIDGPLIQVLHADRTIAMRSFLVRIVIVLLSTTSPGQPRRTFLVHIRERGHCSLPAFKGLPRLVAPLSLPMAHMWYSMLTTITAGQCSPPRSRDLGLLYGITRHSIPEDLKGLNY